MKLKGKEEEGGGAGGVGGAYEWRQNKCSTVGIWIWEDSFYFMRETQKPTPLATLSKHELMVTDAADYYCHDDGVL